MPAPIADAPPATLAPFRGPETTVNQMVRNVAGPRGERSVLVRNVTEHAIRHVQPKDYLSEILAVRNFVAEHCYFTNDALTTEWVKDPQRICEEIVMYGRARIDCDDYASLLGAMLRTIGRDVEFVVVGFGAPNQFSHVLCRVREPKSGRWIVVDPVAGTAEGQMLRKVRTHRVHRVGAASLNAMNGLGENPCWAEPGRLCPQPSESAIRERNARLLVAPRAPAIAEPLRTVPVVSPEAPPAAEQSSGSSAPLPTAATTAGGWLLLGAALGTLAIVSTRRRAA